MTIVRNFPLLSSITAILSLCAGCSGGQNASSSSASQPSGWSGSYACTLTENVTVTAPVSTTLSSSAAAVMSITESGGSSIAATFSGDAGLTCTLTFSDDGDDSATLNPPGTQTCELTADTPVGPAPVKITFTSGGKARRSGPSVKADDLSIQVQDGHGGTLGIQGTGTLAADCTAM